MYEECYEVLICFQDQQRWVGQARITNIEGDFVKLRYETDNENEICSWEEIVRLDSISSIIRQLPDVITVNSGPKSSHSFPDSEPIQDP